MRLNRITTLLKLTVLFILVTFWAHAAEPPQDLRPEHLRMLYSDSLFFNVNRNDALAAIKTWVENLGQRRAYKLAVEISFYDRVEEAAKRIQEKTVDMINCDSADYIQLEPAGQIEPVFSPGWHKVPDEYVVLTRRDRHFASLADLRGKSVLFYRTGAGLGRLWLEATLGEHGLGSVNDFFNSNSEGLKASSVVLPVFFGKADAAVPKRYAWETMKEMNPQLAVQLQILTNSPSLPDAVICLNKGLLEHRFRDDLLRGLAEMHDDPQGQQILLLFRTDRLVPFKPEHLDGVRAIIPKRPERVSTPERKAAVTAEGGGPKS